MTKYRIPSALYENVYALLRQANITSKSIYGDLEGLGRFVEDGTQLMLVHSQTG